MLSSALLVRVKFVEWFLLIFVWSFGRGKCGWGLLVIENYGICCHGKMMSVTLKTEMSWQFLRDTFFYFVIGSNTLKAEIRLQPSTKLLLACFDKLHLNQKSSKKWVNSRGKAYCHLVTVLSILQLYFYPSFNEFFKRNQRPKLLGLVSAHFKLQPVTKKQINILEQSINFADFINSNILLIPEQPLTYFLPKSSLNNPHCSIILSPSQINFIHPPTPNSRVSSSSSTCLLFVLGFQKEFIR
jgi:hypothetical protein